ncbi:hypothetical protein SAMN05216388_1003181 [Halorientalis persicus]|uniref:Uncharacterized protein n=1 Tax=Halorientalis persicus TaxID=1367881 RepID=A0A1H8GS00_9EURY|nr:hypothetical protein [Halorientalis persicus]SEN46589.1 hypothetical protein SAMN05216388_1003181 [Halorientalis persicus]
MVPRVTDIPAPGPVPVALFVLTAAGALDWLIWTGRVALVSLPSVELIFMLLFVSWVGVVRPLRSRTSEYRFRESGVSASHSPVLRLLTKPHQQAVLGVHPVRHLHLFLRRVALRATTP